MKLILDSSVAFKTLVPEQGSDKAIKLLEEYQQGLHELLAPDTFPSDCAEVLVNAERKGTIPPGEIDDHLSDLLAVGVPLHPSFPLLPRAAVIALLTRLTIYASLYIALAEREQCQLLTADQKVIRNTRKHFSFILPFTSLP